MSPSSNPSRWAQVTPRLLFTVMTFSWGNIMYGLDTGSFGSLQALPSWLDKFGVLGANGKYALPTRRKSVMNSVVWIGKALGCLLFEPLVTRIGYKKLMWIVLAIQTLGVILELTARDWIMFSCGRVVAYLAVGLVENATPSYESEIAPSSLRGFISGSLIMLTTLGNLWGGLMSRAYQKETHAKGWIIPTAMQLVPVVMLAIGLPFTPESPRWLVSKGKDELAIANLNKIRPKRDVDSGQTRMEIAALEQAIEEDRSQSSGSWLELFKGNYLRRLMIACWMFIFQQWTGGQFLLSYGPTFYTLVGLGSMAFTYNVILQAMSLVGCVITIFFLDKIGRRPFLVIGTFLQAPLMMIVAGLGTRAVPTRRDVDGLVACIMLFNICVKVSLSTNAYLLASEIGGTRMRKKIIGIATFTDVVAAFVITWSLPYILAAPAFTGRVKTANVGWIFGGIAACAFIFVTFFVPELAGRSLEEVDELFEQKLWAWQFKKYKTTGIGAQISQLERGAIADGASKDIETKEVEDVASPYGVDASQKSQV